jgi:hypothetical protein
MVLISHLIRNYGDVRQTTVPTYKNTVLLKNNDIMEILVKP